MGHISTSKKIILVTLGILLILSLLVGASYAYYIVSVSQTNKNIVKSSCLNLSISDEENVIKLEKQIPIRNEEGKNLTPYTFTITNTCNSFMAYSLNLEELEGSTLSSKYIMTMVNDKTYVNMASLSSTDNYYDSSVEARVLATGSLGANAIIDYSLRLWMDEDTPLTSDAMNKSFKSKIVVVATPTKTVDFDYTGTEQVFTAPVSGTYKLETWGAQGGSYDTKFYGGAGGYSVGLVNLNENDRIYINVGQSGDYCKTADFSTSCNVSQSYNGGGGCTTLTGYSNDGISYRICGSGGGATHIALKTGQLFSLSSSIDTLLIVSGGGGGAGISNYPYNCGAGGSGGGYLSNSSVNLCLDEHIGYGASNSSGYAFGIGELRSNGSGGGGGYYGGHGSISGAGGGSGYIGNLLLTNKAMYCYNCEESSEESTKTISTTCVEETATSNCAKKGNGYARITYIG